MNKFPFWPLLTDPICPKYWAIRREKRRTLGPLTGTPRAFSTLALPLKGLLV